MDEKPNKQVLDYFMRLTGERFDDIGTRLDRMEKKMDKFLVSHWKTVGAIGVLTSIVTALLTSYFKG